MAASPDGRCLTAPPRPGGAVIRPFADAARITGAHRAHVARTADTPRGWGGRAPAPVSRSMVSVPTRSAAAVGAAIALAFDLARRRRAPCSPPVRMGPPTRPVPPPGQSPGGRLCKADRRAARVAGGRARFLPHGPWCRYRPPRSQDCALPLSACSHGAADATRATTGTIARWQALQGVPTRCAAGRGGRARFCLTVLLSVPTTSAARLRAAAVHLFASGRQRDPCHGASRLDTLRVRTVVGPDSCAMIRGLGSAHLGRMTARRDCPPSDGAASLCSTSCRVFTRRPTVSRSMVSRATTRSRKVRSGRHLTVHGLGSIRLPSARLPGTSRPSNRATPKPSTSCRPASCRAQARYPRLAAPTPRPTAIRRPHRTTAQGLPSRTIAAATQPPPGPAHQQWPRHVGRAWRLKLIASAIPFPYMLVILIYQMSPRYATESIREGCTPARSPMSRPGESGRQLNEDQASRHHHPEVVLAFRGARTPRSTWKIALVGDPLAHTTQATPGDF